MITMTPEILHRYAHAIKRMDADPDKVAQERGTYERSTTVSWFEEHAHEYTATQLAGMLNIAVASVRTKAYRLGIQLAPQSPTPRYIK